MEAFLRNERISVNKTFSSEKCLEGFSMSYSIESTEEEKFQNDHL